MHASSHICLGMCAKDLRVAHVLVLSSHEPGQASTSCLGRLHTETEL